MTFLRRILVPVIVLSACLIAAPSLTPGGQSMAAALRAHFEAGPSVEDDGPLPVSHVGCPPPANVPTAILQDPRFQAELFRFSRRTYPLCKVPNGGLPAARRKLRGLPSSHQAPSPPSAPAAASSLSSPTLADGLGETAWSTIGPASIASGYYATTSGHVEALAADPTNPAIIYAGAETGGVWKTVDGGAHWSPPTDTDVTPSVGALAIDPTNHNVIYAGTGNGVYEIDGMGLLKSTDGGMTWTELGTGSTFGWWNGFRKIVVDPVTPTTIWAATSNGLYETTDGGTTWKSSFSGLPQIANWDVALDPTNHNVIYDAVGQNFSSDSQAGIYKSADGGQTWALLTSGPNGNTATPGGSTHVGLIRLAVALRSSAPAAPSLYASVEDPTNSTLYGVYKSTDGGTTWTPLANPDPSTVAGAGTQYWYDDILAADPNDATGNTVWVGGINIFKTTNGGTSWTRLTDVYGANPQRLHPDQHVFAFAGSTLYVGNDGGVYSTSDGGATWPDHNATLDITQFYSAASDASYAPRIIGGSQDNGTNLWSGSTTNLQWQMIYGGDGGATAVDYTAPQTYYEEYVDLDMHRSTDGGSTWQSISSGISDRNNACFVAPFRMDLSNPQHLIAGTREVYQTTNAGTTWTPISGDLTAGGGCVTALAIAPSAPGTTFYASTSNGKVWMTATGGTTWTDVSAGLPTFWRSALAVDPHNPLIAYITGGWCISNGCVWRTADAGATWQNISTGLPNFNVNTVVVDPRDSSHLYIGTDLGALETTNLGASWSTMDTGMPPAEIDELNLNRSGTILTAGTYGRGMYSLFRTWIDPSTSSAPAGGLLTVSGNGFLAGETVDIYWDSPSGASLTSTVANSSGALTASNLSVPSGTVGLHSIIAVGRSSGRTGSTSFTLIAPPPPTTVSVQAHAGWNMVSGSPLTLWPDSSVNWSWNASTGQWYHPTGTEPAGTGAWEYVSAGGARTVTAQQCSSPVSVPVAAYRWNMVGNPCSTPVTLPGAARAYLWNGNAYALATTIPAGQAAWVKPASSSLSLTP